MTAITQLMVLEDNSATAQWLMMVLQRQFPSIPALLCISLADARNWLNTQANDAEPVCLVDLGLPDGNGIDFIAALKQRCPAARAIVTTLFDDDRNLLSAMAAGAVGYLLKDQEPEALGSRLAAFEQGEVPMSPAISRRILEHFRADARFRLASEEVQLTAREEQVLGLIGRGLRVAEVASVLELSRHTIPTYLKSIYRKLGVSTRAEAAVEAARRHLT